MSTTEAQAKSELSRLRKQIEDAKEELKKVKLDQAQALTDTGDVYMQLARVKEQLTAHKRKLVLSRATANLVDINQRSGNNNDAPPKHTP